MHRVVVVCAGAVLALSACSKPEQGSTLPPLPSTSASASASPTAGPTDDKSAIVALAKRYYAEANNAFRTGSTARLRSLAIAGCPCSDFANAIDEEWKKGRVIAPAYYTVVSIGPAILRTPTAGFISVLYRTNGYSLLDASDHPVSRELADPKVYSSSIEVGRANGGWTVTDVIRLV